MEPILMAAAASLLVVFGSLRFFSCEPKQK